MRAVVGMSVMFMVACAVDVRMVPLGILMSMVSLSGICVLAWVGTQCCWKKCPVLPVSAIEEMVVEEGGPSRKGKSEVSKFLIIVFVTVELTW